MGTGRSPGGKRYLCIVLAVVEDVAACDKQLKNLGLKVCELGTLVKDSLNCKTLSGPRVT